MRIIPAIDVMEGKAVRLLRGDFEKKTFYGNPVKVAEAFSEFVDLVHVIDLDGALLGKPVNLKTVREIAKLVPVQVGGGIRCEEDLEKVLEFASKAVVGSWVPERLDKVVVSVDARGGKVCVNGWTRTTAMEAVKLAKKLEERGVKEIVVTDIGRDGTLRGPNLRLLRKVAKAVKMPVIASGGVSSLEDVVKVKETGASGLIVGRALYEKKLDLEEAIANAL